MPKLFEIVELATYRIVAESAEEAGEIYLQSMETERSPLFYSTESRYVEEVKDHV